MKSSQKIINIFIIVACIICSFIAGVYIGKVKDIPFVKKELKWSIAIYTGKDPFNYISPSDICNPVLTAKDVTDVEAIFVADPFMVKEGSTWYMFFEVMNKRTRQGDIGLAVSNDGLDWSYKKIVIDEPFQLSYPYVLKWKDEYYMIPESYQANSVRLYKALSFPEKWLFVKTMLNGRDYVDSSIFYFEDKWWMFASTMKNNVLFLYYADNLEGPWIEHPKSPVIRDNAHIARPGGRVLIFNGHVYRFAQDDFPTYGRRLLAFEITKLTPTTYEEKAIGANPILNASGTGWNAEGMHHIDPHKIGENRWVACVDGYKTFLIFGKKY